MSLHWEYFTHIVNIVLRLKVNNLPDVRNALGKGKVLEGPYHLVYCLNVGEGFFWDNVDRE